MDAGRELDALIAEKVMGWKIEKIRALHLPYYSTDIKDAWEVVEKIKCLNSKADGFGLIFIDGKWHVNYVIDPPFDGINFDDGWSAKSDSLPHAICLAALKAIGYEF